ncbi:MAG: hypothetical protein ACLFTI_06765, partial [Anaerolineales bacterium]
MIKKKQPQALWLKVTRALSGSLTVVALLGLALFFLSTDALISAPAGPPYIYHNGRFGFGLTRSASDAQEGDKPGYLNAGWYWDWSARGASQLPPLTYVQTVRLKPIKQDGEQIGYTASPTGTRLLTAIAQQPGATWFIGNEPDCHVMDNMISEWYAYAYHDMYHIIKEADPTAKIAAGNIVQPTPQRLMYLDRVLAAYEEAYDEPLPADLWSIHSYILCEKCYPYKPPGEPFAWGACWVPDWPSYSASYDIATFYSVYDHWDVEIYARRIITFRQWMVDNGYHNQGLVLPEYGILFYEGLVGGMTYEDDIEFMEAGFEWMQEARDPELGYAFDDDRLVQRWAWFSLDHGSYPGGSLFNPSTHKPEKIGVAFHEATSQITPTTTFLLFDTGVTVAPPAPQSTLTATAAITVSNAGNIWLTDPPSLSVSHTYTEDGVTIQMPITTTDVPALDCCGDHQRVTLDLTDLIKSRHRVCWDVNQPLMSSTITTTPRITSETRCITFGVDLQVDRLRADTLYSTIVDPVTRTVSADVRNLGEIDTGTPVTVTLYQDTESARLPVAQVNTRALAGDGDTERVEIQWPNLTEGLHRYCVQAQTPYVASEMACGILWINPPYNNFLPL